MTLLEKSKQEKHKRLKLKMKIVQEEATWKEEKMATKQQKQKKQKNWWIVKCNSNLKTESDRV